MFVPPLRNCPIHEFRYRKVVGRSKWEDDYKKRMEIKTGSSNHFNALLSPLHCEHGRFHLYLSRDGKSQYMYSPLSQRITELASAIV